MFAEDEWAVSVATHWMQPVSRIVVRVLLLDWCNAEADKSLDKLTLRGVDATFEAQVLRARAWAPAGEAPMGEGPLFGGADFGAALRGHGGPSLDCAISGHAAARGEDGEVGEEGDEDVSEDEDSWLLSEALVDVSAKLNEELTRLSE